MTSNKSGVLRAIAAHAHYLLKKEAIAASCLLRAHQGVNNYKVGVVSK